MGLLAMLLEVVPRDCGNNKIVTLEIIALT